MFSTTENSNSEGESVLSLKKIRSRIGPHRYLIVSKIELENMDDIIGRIQLNTRVISILIIILLALIVSGFILGLEIVLVLGLILITTSLVLESKINRDLISALQAIIGEHQKYLLDSRDEDWDLESTDLYLFYRDEESLKRAETLLNKILRKELESQEYLLFDPQYILGRTLPSRVLLLLGLLLISTKYLFTSILTFVLLGGVIFFVLVDVLGMIMDQVRML